MMNKEEQNKVLQYLEIYADAFNGMVRDALSAKLDDGRRIPSMLAFDPERLKNLVSNYSKVNMENLMENQISLMQQHMDLWQNTNRALLGLEPVQSTVSEESGDKRFSDEEW
ncbi:MAG: hypothetical protein RLN82_04030, partial [Pseudomonadales bacterium]